MICGIGSDVVEIARVKAAILRQGSKFCQRVLSRRELQHINGAPIERVAEFVAGRFAVKEAIAKAAGCGIGSLGLSTVDVSLRDDGGLLVRFEGENYPAGILGNRWHVTITHNRDTAFAVAIRERVDE